LQPNAKKIVLIGEDNYIHQYLRRICYIECCTF